MERQDGAGESSDLRDRVERLEEEVRGLRARVAALESTPELAPLPLPEPVMELVPGQAADAIEETAVLGPWIETLQELKTPPSEELEQPILPPPPPELEPEPVLAPEPIPDRERIPAPVYTGSPFMSEEEYNAPPRPKRKAAVQQPAYTAASSGAPQEGWEIALATRWLPRLGGVLLLAGAAVAGTLITPMLPPGAKLAMGYLVAFAVAAGGWFVRGRNETLGRAVIGISLSLAYFLGFASHFLSPTRIFGNAIPALFLMGVALVPVVVLADRWRSQIVAGMALLLGLLAVLISAGTSGIFALAGLGVLALGGGVVLVRHEWHSLTALSLAAVYLGTAALWVFFPPEQTAPLVLVHLFAVVLYHLIFTAAFWRWGRPWVARELAAARIGENDATPRIDLGTIPYSSSFAMLNTMGLVVLSLFLFWSTKVLMPDIEWLLFGLAAMEGARLLFSPLRRAQLAMFHQLSALSLLAGGIVAAFDGPTEAGALAAQTLLIAAAAGRSRSLLYLRPLTFFTAAWAVRSYTTAPAAGMVNYVTWSFPGLLLMASALPWERLFGASPLAKNPTVKIWQVLDGISAQLRGGIAAVMMAVALSPAIDGVMTGTWLFAALAALPLLGMVLLSAWGVYTGALLLSMCSAVYLTGSLFNQNFEGIPALGLVLPPLVLGFVWVLAWRRVATRGGRLLFLPGQALLCFNFVAAVMAVAAQLSNFLLAMDMRIPGLVIFCISAVWFVVALTSDRFAPADFDADDESDPARSPSRWTIPSWLHLLWGVFALTALISLVTIIKEDSQTTLISAAIVGGLMIVAHVYTGRDAEESDRFVPSDLLALGTLFLVPVSILVLNNAAPVGILGAGAVAMVMWVLAEWMRRPVVSAACGFAVIAATALGMLSAIVETDHGRSGPMMLVALASVTVFAGVVHYPRATALLSLTPDGMLDRLRASFVFVGAACALAALAQPGFLFAQWVTVSWGAAGALLLAVGFLVPDRVARLVSLGVFALAVGRIVLIDLTGASTLARAVAMLGIGLFLVGAALAYGFLQKRLAGGGGNPPN